MSFKQNGILRKTFVESQFEEIKGYEFQTKANFFKKSFKVYQKNFWSRILKIKEAIIKFHASILLVQKRLKIHDVFSFKTSEIDDIEKEINTINHKKTTTSKLVIPFLLQF